MKILHIFHKLHNVKSKVIQTRVAFIAVLFLLGFSVTTGVFNAKTQIAQAAVAGTSKTLNFQARLLNASGNLVPDGSYNIRFKIYNVSSAGAALWTDTRYDTNGVTAGNDFRIRVVNGYFSVNLGDDDPLVGGTAFSGIDWSQQLWLTMDIGGSTQTATPTYDGEMTPRIALSAVPLAFMANNVNSGNTSAASTASANTILQSGNTTGTTSNSGTVTLQSGNVTNGNSGNLVIDSGTASGTKGTISIATANASSLILGRSGLTTLNNGSLTVAETATFNGNLVVGDASTDTATFTANVLANNAATATTATLTAAAGTNVTSLTTTAVHSFVVGDVIFVNNAGQDYYTRVTVVPSTTTLTVDPAVSNDASATITKYNVQNIGAANTGTTFADSARFFQGFFLGGVRTGSGSTTLSDQNLSSTQALYFNTAGTTRLTVSSTGSVSIGNTNNTYPLDVTGNINSSTGYRFNGTAGATTTCTGGQVSSNEVIQGGIVTSNTCATAGTGTVTGTGSNGRVSFWTGANTLSSSALFNWDNTNGNLGLGTATPTSILDVAQPTTGVGTVSNAASGTTVTGVGTQFINTFKVGDTITIGGQTVAITAIASDTSMTTASITAANSGVAYTLVGGTRLSVKGNGNVGIGYTLPNNKLSVNGNASFGLTDNIFQGPSQFGGLDFPRGEILFSNTNTQNQLYLMSNGYGNAGGTLNYRNTNVSATLALDNGAISLITDPSGTGGTGLPLNTRLYVANGGNIGIGSTSPGNKLTIATPFAADDTIPALGANGGKLGIFNNSNNAGGTNYYGLIGGVLSSGNGYLQQQRVDGTATAYNILLQPNGGNIGIGLATSPSARLHVVGAVNTSFAPASWIQNAIFDNAATSSQNITEFRVAGTRQGSLRFDTGGNAVFEGAGTGGTYLALNEGTGGVFFGNGAGGTVGSISSVGNAAVNGTLTVGGTYVLINGSTSSNIYGPGGTGANSWYLDGTNNASRTSGLTYFQSNAGGATYVTLGSTNTFSTAVQINSSLGVSTSANISGGLTSGTSLTNSNGDIRFDLSHGNNMRILMPAARNGASTGDAGLYLWISEPAATWTGAGIARNMSNSSGSFARVNTGLSGQMIRFDEGTNMNFSVETSAGARTTPLVVAAGGISVSGDVTGVTSVTATNLIGANTYFTSTSTFGVGTVCYTSANGFGWYQYARCAASSARYKNTITNYQGSASNGFTGGLDEVRALRPVNFYYNQGVTDDNTLQLGFIAEEVAAINPLYASYENGVIQSVHYEKLTVVLTKAVQQLDVQVQSINTRLNVLETGQFNGNLTVVGSGSFAGNLSVAGDTTVQTLYVNGKIISGGDAPAVALGLAAGSIFTGEATVTGNDTAGTLSIKTGSTGTLAGQVLGAVTFHTPYDKSPTITLTPTSEGAANIRYFLLKTTEGWSIKVLDAPATSQVYSFDYHVIQ